MVVVVENNNERSQLEALLKKVEKDLEEQEKKTLRLQNTRDYIRSELGFSIAEKVKEEPSVSAGVHTGTLPVFRKGDFYGFSQTEAGYKVLERSGGSLTVDEILKTLLESGYSVGGEEPRRTLYVSLCRSRKLVLVAENTFDLAERRPQARKRREKKAQPEGQVKAVLEGGEEEKPL